MRSRLIIPFIVLAACGDDSATLTDTRSDTRDAGADSAAPDDSSAPDDSAAPDDSSAPDGSDPEDSAPDAVADSVADADPADTTADSAADTDDSAPDTFNPQADAWTQGWSLDSGAGVLALRYLGGQNTSSLLAIFDATGDVGLAGGDDAAPEPLAGEGHRLVIADLDPATGAIRSSQAIALGEGESVGDVTKGPNGFGVAIAGPSERVVMGQVFGTTLRVATVTVRPPEPLPEPVPAEEDGDTVTPEAPLGLALPVSGDLAQVTSGGSATPLALQIDAPAGAILSVSVGAASLDFVLPQGGGVGFLTLAPPRDEKLLLAEGTSVEVVPLLRATRVVETQSGPVVEALVEGETTIRDTTLTAGQATLLIGAIPEAVADGVAGGPAIPVVLWSSSETSAVEVVQIASSGVGGLVLAGVGEGELGFSDEPEALEPARPFVASIGGNGGILYTAEACDEILALTAGFSLRILRIACDLEGVGPALVLTLVSADFDGELGAPYDLVLAPLGADRPALLSGLVSFNVSDGRAYGGLFDFGLGPRLLVVREDGQLYDSGVLQALGGAGAGPSMFLPLRQGGGGGGGNNPNTNAVIYVVPGDGGAVIGRARIDLKTFIW